MLKVFKCYSFDRSEKDRQSEKSESMRFSFLIVVRFYQEDGIRKALESH